MPVSGGIDGKVDRAMRADGKGSNVWMRIVMGRVGNVLNIGMILLTNEILIMH